MIYYGIKYAISSGKILEFSGRDGPDPGYVYQAEGWFNQYRIGRDAFIDRADAVNAAKAMRDKKVASLRKQIAKLEAMDFSA